MERQRPNVTSNDIELYIRSIYSLLRSSGQVRVRSLEEAHIYSDSSLHLGARERIPDLSALGYAAARLPPTMPQVELVVLGQASEQFERSGLDVGSWSRVRAKGRRRPMRQKEGVLALFIASASDIDDVVPILAAYQIEWNKVHHVLAAAKNVDFDDDASTASALEVDVESLANLRRTLGSDLRPLLEAMQQRPSDLRLDLLAGSFNHYQRAAHRWWSGIEPVYAPNGHRTRPRPVYFVSSNTHSLANLLGGYALAHRDAVAETARDEDPEGVWTDLDRAMKAGSDEASNLLYFCLRYHMRRHPELRNVVVKWDQAAGVRTVQDPGQVEVTAQVIELSRLRPELLDPRVRIDGLERLADSDAVILNIDYPLGMAAYQLLSRVGQGVGDLRGVYVMGKAATLNGRVGDVMISKVIHDEHSLNSYLVRNAFSAKDLEPHLVHGSVLDNQKALTVRSALLQNRNYMGVFYREGYTVLEMEAGPYLSAIYELVDPRRHPRDEIVSITDRAPFEIGILHYASDTPYSRRQELLSKSLGYFGMDATYACAVAITRRVFEMELTRLNR